MWCFRQNTCKFYQSDFFNFKKDFHQVRKGPIMFYGKIRMNWFIFLVLCTLFFCQEHTIQAFRSYSWKVITNTHIKLNVNKESNNYESKNETNIFSSWQSGIGSKLERDFKLTEKFSGFITRRAGKSISGLVDAVSSIETPLTTPKGKGGAKLVGNLDATSTKKRILRKKKAEVCCESISLLIIAVI